MGEAKGRAVSNLFLLTIAVALLIVAAASIYAFIVYRRETRRALYGRGHEGFQQMRRRRLVT
jgi:heme/copper-type cytochrome/quinol oxidase subunit 2